MSQVPYRKPIVEAETTSCCVSPNPRMMSPQPVSGNKPASAASQIHDLNTRQRPAQPVSIQSPPQEGISEGSPVRIKPPPQEGETSEAPTKNHLDLKSFELKFPPEPIKEARPVRNRLTLVPLRKHEVNNVENPPKFIVKGMSLSKKR